MSTTHYTNFSSSNMTSVIIVCKKNKQQFCKNDFLFEQNLDSCFMLQIPNRVDDIQTICIPSTSCRPLIFNNIVVEPNFVKDGQLIFDCQNLIPVKDLCFRLPRQLSIQQFRKIQQRTNMISTDVQQMESFLRSELQNILSQRDLIYKISGQELPFIFNINFVNSTDFTPNLPVIIALHGGGGCPKEVNDSQFEHMKVYYQQSIPKNIACVYITIRGLRDVWNEHSQPEHERFIRVLLASLNVLFNCDINRAMLTGFSAGGDGGHALGSSLADIFAFVNSSAGHPNGGSYLNRSNQVFWIQCGENDSAYDRNIVNARYGLLVSQLCYANLFQGCCLIHKGKGHNFGDCQNGQLEVFSQFGKDAKTEMVMCQPVVFFLGNENISRNLRPRSFYFHTDSSLLDPKVNQWKFLYNIALKIGDDQNGVIKYEISADKVKLNIRGLSGNFLLVLLFDDNSPVALSINDNESLVQPLCDVALRNQFLELRLDPYFDFQFFHILDYQENRKFDENEGILANADTIVREEQFIEIQESKFLGCLSCCH